MPDLYETAAHWQWALDAAARALEADRFDLPAEEVADESRRVVAERRETATLLARAAAAEGRPPPFLASRAVTPRLIGLPAGAEACVLDLDGVLTDSDALHAAAWAATLDPVLLAATHPAPGHLVPFDRTSDYDTYFDGRPRLEGIRLFFAGRGLQLAPHVEEQIACHKSELLQHGLDARGVAALDGARRYLEACRLARLGRAVVSASTSAAPMLELAGLAALVDVQVDAATIRTEGLRARPAPDLLFAACRLLGAEPTRTVSLTHTGAGVVAALSIGMPVVGVAAGARADELRAYGAPKVVSSLAALLASAGFPPPATSFP